MQITGSQYKAIFKVAMPIAKAKGDRNEFKAARIELDGNKARVHMERYSLLRCYWDRDYSFAIEKSTTAGLQIVEESAITQAWSDCK